MSENEQSSFGGPPNPELNKLGADKSSATKSRGATLLSDLDATDSPEDLYLASQSKKSKQAVSLEEELILDANNLGQPYFDPNKLSEPETIDVTDQSGPKLTQRAFNLEEDLKASEQVATNESQDKPLSPNLDQSQNSAKTLKPTESTDSETLTKEDTKPLANNASDEKVASEASVKTAPAPNAAAKASQTSDQAKDSKAISPKSPEASPKKDPQAPPTKDGESAKNVDQAQASATDLAKDKAVDKAKEEPKAAAKASAKPKVPADKAAKKTPAKKATGKAQPPAKAGNLVEQDRLYLPEPRGKRTPATRSKDQKQLVLLQYISIVFRQDGWQAVYSGLRKELWSKSFARRLIMATVVIPGIFIFFYLLLWASPAYISEAKFAVRGQSSAQALEGLSSLFSFPSSTQNDSYIVLNYIMSLDLFNKLDQELKLREHYSDKKYDLWYRLWQNATQDDIIRFWKWACETKYDPDTSILEVQVKAFTPEKALEVCQGILKASEELVNSMNTRSRQDAISKAQVEVDRAEERIRKARVALQAYREKTVILDPEAVASGLYGVVNKLEGDVTRTAAELSEAMTFMNKDSPRVKQLENRLLVLQKQLAQEKKRLAGKVKGNESLSSLLSEFQNLALEEEFAQKQLTSAMTSLEAARIQADSQTHYVEAFERPVLADQSLYPRPALFTILYMLTTLLLLGLVSLIVAAVREHAGF